MIRYLVVLLIVSCGVGEQRAERGLLNKPSMSGAQTALAARGSSAARVPNAAAPLVLPYSTGRIVCDGNPDEAGWQNAMRTGDFVDLASGEAARPYSEARFMANATSLYLLLYAADQDLREPASVLLDEELGANDHFTVQIRRTATFAPTFIFELAPDRSFLDARVAEGVIDRSWTSHAKIGVDVDGVPNDPSGDDEEWLIEASLPLRTLGIQPGETILVSVQRCDTPKGSAQVCSAWGLGAQGLPEAALSLASASP